MHSDMEKAGISHDSQYLNKDNEDQDDNQEKPIIDDSENLSPSKR